ncbi:MAG: hypothetical protein QM709_07940 [Spongiibacteraceae bacterium]
MQKLKLTSLLLLIPLTTNAGPMGFQDSWMSMGDTSPNWREIFANYALTVRDAIGISQTYMLADDDSRSRSLTELTYTRLLHRWNQPESQANLWFIGGVGDMRLHDRDTDHYSNRLALTPGIQADYETTRIYFSATHRLYRADAINHDYSAVRAGFSFFETDYEHTQPWLIVEARSMNSLSEKAEITPMLRLINRNYFIEAGANTTGQPRFNFMLIF